MGFRVEACYPQTLDMESVLLLARSVSPNTPIEYIHTFTDTQLESNISKLLEFVEILSSQNSIPKRR